MPHRVLLGFKWKILLGYVTPYEHGYKFLWDSGGAQANVCFFLSHPSSFTTSCKPQGQIPHEALYRCRVDRFLLKNAQDESPCLFMLQIMMNVCWDTMAVSKSVTISLEASTALATRDMNSTKTTKLVQVKGHSPSYNGLLVLKSTSRHHLSCQLTKEIVIALRRGH